MPAEKGIPKPEFNCVKLDRRMYDSRQTWGWVSEDSRYIVNHDGEVFYRMDPIDLEWEDDKPTVMALREIEAGTVTTDNINELKVDIADLEQEFSEELSAEDLPQS